MTDEQPTVVSEVGAWVMVSAEMMEDAAVARRAIDGALHRYLYPWEYPDRPKWPDRFVLIPWLERFTSWWLRRRDERADVWVEEW